MLNNVDLIGRIVKDPEEKKFSAEEGTEKISVRYCLAVERDYKINDARPVDYINCSAAGAVGEYAKMYFRQGDTVAVSGRIFSEKYKSSKTEEERFYTGVQVRSNYMVRKKRNMEEEAQTGIKKQTSKTLEKAGLPDLPEGYDK